MGRERSILQPVPGFEERDRERERERERERDALTDALEDHEYTVSIGGRIITNLRFADGIDGLAGEEKESAK